MEENENVVENATVPSEPLKEKKNIGAAIKERFRRFIVKLKRNTKIIPYTYLIIIMFLWLVWLFTFSRSVAELSKAEWGGMSIFLTTLFSILSVAVFGSAFPKRKKTNIAMLCVLFAFLVIVILSQVLYYVKVGDYIKDGSGYTADDLAQRPYLQQSLTLSVVVMILYGIGILLVATLPLYKKLLLKINTRKNLEENKLSEEIDTSEEV